MSHLPAAAFIKDAAGYYLYGNNVLSEFLQQDPGSIAGSRDEELLPAELARRFAEDERRVLAGEVVEPQIVQLFDHDDAPSWLLLRFPVEDAARRRFIGGMAINVTLQTRAEQHVRELNESLEQRVAQRTEELTNANKELEAFSYSVSHDLRAPLRAIDGYARMIVEDYGATLDEEGRRFLNVIRAETGRMAGLIDDLLSFSRLSRTALSPAPVDLSALTEEVIAEVKAGKPERRIVLVKKNLPFAVGDRAILRHVLTNLFSNAVKYSKPTGDITVEISGQQGPEFNTYCVRDQGVGFDMAYAGKLFGVFQRLHTDEEFEGTGVGLAIVRRIIERHGGRCWAEGQEGVGAAFYFTLPAPGSRVSDEKPEVG